ncbi:hypothetical protein GCM10023148_10790 [Actinokineospora soli]
MAGDGRRGGQLGAGARPVAVDDVGGTGQAGARAAAVVAVEQDDEDQGECDERQHGTKFALNEILPRVAEVPLCVKILPATVAAC